MDTPDTCGEGSQGESQAEDAEDRGQREEKKAAEFEENA